MHYLDGRPRALCRPSPKYAEILTLTVHRTWVLAAFVACLAVLTAAGLAACGSGGPGGASASPDAVVARVDGRAVHQSAVDQARAEARFAGADDDAGAALEAAIDRELVRAEAQRLGLAADAAEVERRLAAVGAQLGGDAALKAARELAAMSEDQLRESLRAGVLRKAVQDARFPQVKAGPAAARRFYERRRAELFTVPAAVKLGAIVARNEGIAGNAVKRLRAGRPFDEVARQFSVDPELKSAGGAMGWIDPRSMPEPLSRAVARLRVGATSRPVAGPGGAWIFRVLARRPHAWCRSPVRARRSRTRSPADAVRRRSTSGSPRRARTPSSSVCRLGVNVCAGLPSVAILSLGTRAQEAAPCVTLS